MEKITLKDLLLLPKSKLANKIICFPTDTVYGVGAIATDSVAIEKIYEMKNRNINKALPILVSNIEMANEIANISEIAKEYMEKYWPGALTVVLEKLDNALPNYKTKTIALRMPNSKIALSIIDHFSALATTSINVSGEKELNDINEIEAKFGNYLDYLVIDKEPLSKVASTIIDVSDGSVKVLRSGDIKIL